MKYRPLVMRISGTFLISRFTYSLRVWNNRPGTVVRACRSEFRPKSGKVSASVRRAEEGREGLHEKSWNCSSLGDLDAALEAVIRADQVVIRAHPPGVAEVTADFGLLFDRHPAAGAVPLARLVLREMVLREPAERVVPDVPFLHLLVGKRSNPFLAAKFVAQDLAGDGLIRILPDDFQQDLEGVVRIAGPQGLAAQT